MFFVEEGEEIQFHVGSGFPISRVEGFYCQEREMLEEGF